MPCWHTGRGVSSPLVSSGSPGRDGRTRDACSRRGRLVHHLCLAAWVWPKADPGSSGDVPCTAWRLTGAHGVRHDGGMARCGEDVRDALVRQWEAIAAAVATVDLEIPSRVTGWRNREVVAHLCLQPALLRRFVATALMRDAVAGVAANLAGTRSLAGLIDASARQAAEAGRVDFARAVEDALPLTRMTGTATGTYERPGIGSTMPGLALWAAGRWTAATWPSLKVSGLHNYRLSRKARSRSPGR